MIESEREQSAAFGYSPPFPLPPIVTPQRHLFTERSCSTVSTGFAAMLRFSVGLSKSVILGSAGRGACPLNGAVAGATGRASTAK